METKGRLTPKQKPNILKKTNFNLKNTKIYQEVGQTTFLGINIDVTKGPFDFRIKKALKSNTLLNIIKFIEVTSFKLNMIMFDYFWQVIVGNHSSHITRETLDWFGYEGEYYTQKQNFKKMLQRNSIKYTELSQENKVESYPTIKKELETLPHEGAKACSKFLIMEPDDLKMAIMQLKTKNGDIIRQYYIDLEKLLKLYTEYTLYFNHKLSQKKITDLEQIMADMRLEREEDRRILQQQTQYIHSLGISLNEVKDQNEDLLMETKTLTKQNNSLCDHIEKIQRKLGVAVEDRAPLPVDKVKQERFVLIKRNNNDYYPYYTIRAQYKYTECKIKAQRTLFPDMEILLDFKANPNSKTLYTRIKDELKAQGVYFNGTNIDLEGSNVNENDLVNRMKLINDQKYDI